jgi:hypothetical protein
MELSQLGWQIAAITTGLLVISAAWIVVHVVQERDAFRRASDLQLPISARVRAIAILSRSDWLLDRRWRHENVARLLSDLRTYDRSPRIRHAAAEALQRIPADWMPEHATK